jgi:hypothetical protein
MAALVTLADARAVWAWRASGDVVSVTPVKVFAFAKGTFSQTRHQSRIAPRSIGRSRKWRREVL